MQVDVYDRAIDWAWGIVIAVAGVMGGAVIRLWRHEERIKALEKANSERTEAIIALTRKVDENHSDIGDRIDEMGSEIRSDLRIIMGRCLTINHKID